jgi:multidrug efflux pump subunit AcrA (membrane-fusion protein)
MNLIPERLKGSNFVLGAASVASAVLTLLLIGCSSERQTVSAAPETVSNVLVVSAQTVIIPDVVEAVGSLRAAETGQLAAQMMGNIVEIRVREGDHVQRGQVLAVIDESQPRAALDRATAADTAAQHEISAAE